VGNGFIIQPSSLIYIYHHVLQCSAGGTVNKYEGIAADVEEGKTEVTTCLLFSDKNHLFLSIKFAPNQSINKNTTVSLSKERHSKGL